MGFRWKNPQLVQRLGSRLQLLVSDFGPDVKEAGSIMADEIVRTTLAGIGDGDQPFREYSPAYRALIESVGGKASGVVDLRGVFEKRAPKGGEYSRTARSRGAGRRAYVEISAGGRRFFARTKRTRPRLGLVDPQSEMSRDLITVEVTGAARAKIVYKPRAQSYMILHNEDRKWFSVNKTAVQAAGVYTLQQLFAARCDAFNRGS